LSRLEGDRLVPFHPEAPWSTTRVEAILEDDHGVLWVSTDGAGLFRIVGDAWTPISTREGLFDDTVFDLLQDDAKNLWMSGPRGVFRVGREVLDDFGAGRATRISGTLLGVADGMSSSECTGGGSEPGALRDREGRLWFPTTKGVAMIDPRHFAPRAAPRAPLIEEVRFDRAPLATSGPLVVGPGRGDLELRFSTVDFVSPGSLRFRYRLEGFDPAWVESGDRRIAHYGNLLPGSYRFAVQASNDGATWGSPETTIGLRLRPHFYQTVGFRGAGVVVLGLAVFGLHRLRVRRLATRARELVQINEALHESEERYAVAARGANDGLWDWNLKTGAVHYSPRWKAMIGCAEDEVSDRPEEWLDRVHPDDQAALKAELAAHLEGKSPHFESEHRIRRQDGVYRHVLSRGLVVRDPAGNNLRLAGSQTDITERKEVEARILHDALHDPLTGFPNRTLFLDRLGQAVVRRHRRPDHRFGVLFLDLDRFKLVNDSLGHLAGDALLVSLAERLRGCVRNDDTVARLGGDEFAILLDDMSDPEEATRVAERIQEALRQPFSVDGHEIFSTASIGITVDDPRDRKPEELLRDADTAMYRAKGLGRDRYETFDEGMHARAVALLKLESDFRRALDRSELSLIYQPILHLRSGSGRIFEALVRWRHPERGLLSPDEFIPLAEETGLIVPLGQWVLREACAAVRAWRDAGGARGEEASVSVNLSVREFSQDDLVGRVADLLRQHDLGPGSLKLEITESVIMGDPEAAIVRCLALRELGVGIAIDDFGTGYSSLSYLRRLPVDALKIDRSFVSSMLESTESLEIVRAILSLAGTLRIATVAEGVETREQLEKLRELGCDFGQGYLFARPMPREEAFARAFDLAR
jgi:diguanylate cyclase (GGDEF)-like protein/PAS domain S-box-containing protein